MGTCYNVMPMKYNHFVEKEFPYSISAFACGIKIQGNIA